MILKWLTFKSVIYVDIWFPVDWAVTLLFKSYMFFFFYSDCNYLVYSSTWLAYLKALVFVSSLLLTAPVSEHCLGSLKTPGLHLTALLIGSPPNANCQDRVKPLSHTFISVLVRKDNLTYDKYEVHLTCIHQSLTSQPHMMTEPCGLWNSEYTYRLFDVDTQLPHYSLKYIWKKKQT